jgi:hypothetical protein
VVLLFHFLKLITFGYFNSNDENKVLPDFDCRCLNVLSDIEVCEQDVIDIISTLNVDKAVGHDIISNRMVLTVKNEIAKPLSWLFNRRENIQASTIKIQ